MRLGEAQATMLQIVSPPVLTGLRAIKIPLGDWETLNDCPICGSSNNLHDVVCVVDGPVATACSDCEYVFLKRRPTASWLNHFYSTDWDESGKNKRADTIEKKTIRGNDKVLKFAEPYLEPQSTVLDIGGGFGKLLVPFKENGHIPYAIERSAHRAEFLRDVCEIETTHVPIEIFQPDQKFGLVFMNHVFEHVSNPKQVISHVARILKPGGLIYIAVPDLSDEFAPKSVHFVPHLHWYSVKALKRVLNSCGFSVLQHTTGREIQILARLSAPGQFVETPADNTDPASFMADLEKTVMADFGTNDQVESTIVWFKGAASSRYWERKTYRGASAIRSVTNLARRVVGQGHSKRIRNVLARVVCVPFPGFLKGYIVSPNAGSISVRRVSPSTQLPVTLKHLDSANVWVK